MKNALYIQSGGPTTVINATAYGVITACKAEGGKIGRLYAAEHGIMGLINSRLIDVYREQPDELERLINTPSSIFGSCRYRVTDAIEDDTDYRRILEVLKRFNIGYIFYNGGNGTLRACKDLSNYLKDRGYECGVIAIPKTVDNDVAGIDHAPGFPSAARHAVITVSELAHDIRVYDTGLIMVLEVMGRNTGWLAASTFLSAKNGNGPDLIYTPERVFDDERFLGDVEEVYRRQGKVLAVVAEGVRTQAGKYLFELESEVFDNDPGANMGGITPYLTRILRRKFPCKIRGIDLGLMQRCGMHSASPIDVREAVELGENAVRAALDGADGKMVSLGRVSSRPYVTAPELIELERVAGVDKVMPESYISGSGNFIEDSFLEYIEPLVGELPRYSKLCLETAPSPDNL